MRCSNSWTTLVRWFHSHQGPTPSSPYQARCTRGATHGEAMGGCFCAEYVYGTRRSTERFAARVAWALDRCLENMVTKDSSCCGPTPCVAQAGGDVQRCVGWCAVVSPLLAQSSAARAAPTLPAAAVERQSASGSGGSAGQSAAARQQGSSPAASTPSERHLCAPGSLDHSLGLETIEMRGGFPLVVRVLEQTSGIDTCSSCVLAHAALVRPSSSCGAGSTAAVAETERAQIAPEPRRALPCWVVACVAGEPMRSTCATSSPSSSSLERGRLPASTRRRAPLVLPDHGRDPDREW